MLTRILLLLIVVLSQTAQGQGQYRSRILVDPLGELTKGGELTVEELEQQIDGIKDPYARSSATRHLARHYVQEGDYAAAIDYYRQALAGAGLSDIANREMLRELAQVYLLNEGYRDAEAALEQVLEVKLVPAAADFLLLAQARYKQQDYVGVVAALDGIAANGLKLDQPQMEQAFALYYRAGAYEQCEELLRQLLAMEPARASYWHQLATVYLQQGKRQQALDHLVLAMEKGIPFKQEELVLLIDLQAINGNPYGAAQLLEQAMRGGQLPGSADNQRKAFELWFQARERNKATDALKKAAQATGDTELYLYLAQLQMEDQLWEEMLQTLLQACEQQLGDQYVSRANLLLGVSLLKQNRVTSARRAFINATLVGGAHAQAAQWLQFMEAAPASEAELRRVSGPCYGSEGNRASLQQEPEPTASAAVAAEPELPESAAMDAAVTVAIKTVPATRFYYSSHSEPLSELLPELGSLAVRLNVTLVKAGAAADGPPQLLLQEGQEIRLALPVRGTPQAKGRYRSEKSGPFKCAWMQVDGQGEEALAEAQRFAAQVQAAGYSLTGERRLVSRGGRESGFELQLGIE